MEVYNDGNEYVQVVFDDFETKFMYSDSGSEGATGEIEVDLDEEIVWPVYSNVKDSIPYTGVMCKMKYSDLYSYLNEINVYGDYIPTTVPNAKQKVSRTDIHTAWLNFRYACELNEISLGSKASFTKFAIEMS